MADESPTEIKRGDLKLQIYSASNSVIVCRTASLLLTLEET
jgi:hypothetical protein